MREAGVGRLVVLSGPSCVGKSPLHKALGRLFPDWHQKLRPLVLFNSRPPRPGELDGRDYHFRSRPAIEALRDDPRYAVLEVRGDLQALDLEEVRQTLATSEVLFEGNPFVGRLLLDHPKLSGIDRLSVFVSPLSGEEIGFVRTVHEMDLPSLVQEVMRRKLLRRLRKQKGEASYADLQEVERRSASAYRELCLAHDFQHVIANHDGEDSENWDAFYYPIGDARRTLYAFVALLEERPAEGAEHWSAELLPEAEG
jgi:guanylate kinase